MKKYPAKSWQHLGRVVYLSRLEAGIKDTQEWADKVGRSSRMLLGLERGEPVGSGTLDRVALALNWAPEAPYTMLDDPIDAEIFIRSTRESVRRLSDDDDEFEFLTRVREDLTDEEMEEMMKEATPYLEMLVRDIKRRRG